MTLHTEPPALAESRIFPGTVLNLIEHLQYNEQEQNLKNFLTNANLSTRAKIVLTYNTHAIQVKIVSTPTTHLIF